ncbi:hypothetical protein BC827DRAFT_1386151 [Russula dissimulans]|nr:hypothetical protein BC827DRAFT_1386151 [Russula dissimulans]
MLTFRHYSRANSSPVNDPLTVTCNDSCVVSKHGIMYCREKKTRADSCLGLRVALRTQHNTTHIEVIHSGVAVGT